MFLGGTAGWGTADCNSYVAGLEAWGETPASTVAQQYYNTGTLVGAMGCQGDSLGCVRASGEPGPVMRAPGQLVPGGLSSDPTSDIACAAQEAAEKGRREHAKRKGLIAASDAELSGGIFHDVDPAMVPADMLPVPMMADQAILTKGTLERHTFLAIGPLAGCTLRLRGPGDDDGFIDVEDEVEGCEALMQTDQERLVAAKQKAKAQLHEEDQEMLYFTPYVGNLPI
ncbi:RNA recognition motif-containing protein [Besnoitia besnoiti]|uniref:RNA recognition motif-containing protein n=1 Tax=Besnoitia besnoiti TaxID=94643 RepID=A0A2A9MMH3_BESBE|nr:RNA recognition motif-containing protein [Besnoitia besnoiti]PFH36770.1 RNA recognition motif-containing protein [Besnoitia besnoiti]